MVNLKFMFVFVLLLSLLSVGFTRNTQHIEMCPQQVFVIWDTTFSFRDASVFFGIWIMISENLVASGYS